MRGYVAFARKRFGNKPDFGNKTGTALETNVSETFPKLEMQMSGIHAGLGKNVSRFRWKARIKETI